jgi:hypothetical protein
LAGLVPGSDPLRYLLELRDRAFGDDDMPLVVVLDLGEDAKLPEAAIVVTKLHIDTACLIGLLEEIIYGHGGTARQERFIKI